MGTQLAHNIGTVIIHGFTAYPQGFSNQAITHPAGNLPEHFTLPIRQGLA